MASISSSFFRCGGFIGCDIYEKPYLTEAGSEVFNQVYRMLLKCQYQLELQSEDVSQGSRKTEMPIVHYVSMVDLLRDISRLLVGVSSKCFEFDEVSHLLYLPLQFTLKYVSCLFCFASLFCRPLITSV